MTLSPEGLRLFWQLRHDAVASLASRLEEIREDIWFHIEFLRPVLEFGLMDPMVSYLVWLREVQQARGLPGEHLADSVRWLGEFYAGRLAAADASALSTVLNDVLAALEQAQAAPASPAVADLDDWPEALLFERALLDGQHHAALHVVQHALAQGHSLPDIETHVVQPAMVRIGEGWQANRVTVAQEHMATAIAHAILSSCLDRDTLPPPNGLRILLACVEGNHHALGLRMVADAFEVQGWEVTYLGANVPTRSLVDMVVAERPHLLGLSVSFAPQLGAVRDTIAQLQARMSDARPPVMVGGLAINRFRPLAHMLGVDGHAASAQDAVSLASQLLTVTTKT